MSWLVRYVLSTLIVLVHIIFVFLVLAMHNPLQALTYLALKLFLFPAIWISGLAYLLYDFWATNPMANQTLSMVALVHVATAFAMLIFIIHVYMLTTDHSFVAHVKPMITGFDEVELSEAEEHYLEEDEPDRIK